ncbi:DUF6343 family protein [Streptomyces poonensis]|uniref:Uncharacterized protein n=1 Tax=Streptomyces poonensis TaxID=68255 RepID=A0A918PDA5_9ACTN|nr:DUF6343 family protein [Streptomyces poonensis]GGZ00478.1 hypothetical protein GCM10010365_19080 [Streptomyces poonensis]GLJ93736.1 hypothetical protein GCM10017589_63520 [Streptomyces poonensis]
MSAHPSQPAGRRRHAGGLPRRTPVPEPSGRYLGGSGTEPRTARTALRLRRILAVFFLPVFTVAAVLFGVWAAHHETGDRPDAAVLTGLAVGCAVLAVVTAVDLVVVLRRLRRQGQARH